MSKPIVAIMYDFDRTLSTKDMQEFSFIPALNMSSDSFWGDSDAIAKQNKMDYILATMYLMMKKAREDGVDLSREALKKHGEKVEFYPGVENWFARVNSYGEALGLEVRHYIISCGMKPMIEGCKIAKEFYNVFACDFLYDDDGFPVWPSIAINYSSKIQFLFRIKKGVEDVSEHDKLNKRTPKEQTVVPFQNMIYVGDGLTDVPSMKMVRLRGGHAIGVFRDEKESHYLVDDDRVDFFVKADYKEGSQIDNVIKALLEKIAAEQKLRSL